MLLTKKATSNSESVELAKYLNSIIDGLPKHDAEFRQALIKWKPLLYKNASYIAISTKGEPLDALADLMVHLVNLNATYDIPLYRCSHANKVYEMVSKGEDTCILRTPRYNKFQKEPFAVPLVEVVQVRKATLASLVYRKVQQQTCAMLRNKFTQKNGYFAIGSEVVQVKRRDPRSAPRFDTVQKNTMFKAAETPLQGEVLFNEGATKFFYEDVLSSNDIFNYQGSDSSPEAESNYTSIRRSVKKGLSWPARAVFDVMCEDATISKSSVTKILGLPYRQVQYAHREIAVETAKVLDLKSNQSYTRHNCTNPVHLRSELICV